MKSYRVRWEIDIEAESPCEAAVKALLIQRNQDPENTATVFDVIAKGVTIRVDLTAGTIRRLPTRKRIQQQGDTTMRKDAQQQ